MLRFQGCRFAAPPRDVGAFYSICYAGVYDRLLRQIDSGDVVVDGGANVGVFSILAARKARVVYAIEPHPVNFRFLVRNLEVNRCSNVVPINAALWSQEGSGFLEGDDETGHVSRTGRPIRLTTLDSVCNGVADILKLDIEGAELTVLEGQRTTNRARLIAFEPEQSQVDALYEQGLLAGEVRRSYQQLEEALLQKGFSIDRYSDEKVDYFEKLLRWETLLNELQTGFFGVRYYLKVRLTTGDSIFVPKSWDKIQWLTMTYATRAPSK